MFVTGSQAGVLFEMVDFSKWYVTVPKTNIDMTRGQAPKMKVIFQPQWFSFREGNFQGARATS